MLPETLVIGSVREVQDLDNWLHLFAANSDADKCKFHQAFIRALYEAERARREDDKGDAQEYPHADFESWPTTELIKTAMFAAGAIEWVFQTGQPTLLKFAADYNRALVAVLSSRLTGTGTPSAPTG